MSKPNDNLSECAKKGIAGEHVIIIPSLISTMKSKSKLFFQKPNSETQKRRRAAVLQPLPDSHPGCHQPPWRLPGAER